jgi:NADH-quinone oxidoreductase subunit N
MSVTPADLSVISPLICVGAAAIAVMLMVAVHRSYVTTFLLTMTGLAAAVATLPWRAGAAHHPLPLLVFDGYAALFTGLLVTAAAGSLLFAFGYLRKYESNREEFFILMLLATLGAVVLASGNHFASFFLGIELLSVSLYALVAYPHKTDAHTEAGVKYLVLAAVSSAFILFGMALIYADTGSMVIDRIGPALRGMPLRGGDPWLLAGLAMMLVGIGFKLGLVPFHLWTPDVYQGAPAPVTAFVATVSKGGVLAALLRLFPPGDIHTGSSLFFVFSAIAIASMLAGNLLALLQNNVKRILAYSSIAHLGYMLVAFLSGRSQGGSAVTFYLMTYFISILGAFGVITVLSAPGREMESIDDYRGLFWRRPWLAGVFSAMVLSLAGLPLAAGFIGKFYLIMAGVGATLWTLVIVLVLSSTVGLYYYLRVLFIFFVKQPEPQGPVAPEQAFSLSGALTLAVLTFLLIWLGVMPAPIFDLIQTVVH